MCPSLDVRRPDLTLGIVGAGVMGRGIAQIAARAGIRVILQDLRPGAAGEARDAVMRALAERAPRREDRVGVDGTIEAAKALSDLAGCHVIVEAIVEDLAAKQELFRELERVVAADCLLATNTSSLRVTSVAAACAHPERVGGFHFFNPVPRMKVVEVIDGCLTAPWVGSALVTLAGRLGHAAVRAQDTPGFIVNHAGRGYGTEALQILREGIAGFHQIDRILRDCAGFRMGPFELFDLIGLDVSHPVMESIYDQYYQEPRYRPSPVTAQRLAAGLLGRKSAGGGFYVYADGKAKPIPEDPVSAADVPRVWIARSGLGADVAGLLASLGASIDDGTSPGPGSLILVAPIGSDASSTALALGADPQRTVAVDAMLGLSGRRTLMTTPATRPEMRNAAHALFARDGTPVSVIRDSPGFVAQRVVAHIVNIGCDIVQQGICTPADLDLAVTLGLGYPKGPLAWGDRIGPARVLQVLDGLFDFYGDSRYRPSPWLKRRAGLGLSLLHAGN